MNMKVDQQNYPIRRGEKKSGKKKYRPREYVGNIKRWNILIIGVASKEKRENGR